MYDFHFHGNSAMKLVDDDMPNDHKMHDAIISQLIVGGISQH